MYKNILIPTDGSELSQRTIGAAIALAKAIGARVTGLYVTPTATPVVFKGLLPVGYQPPEEHEEALANATKRYLAAIEQAATAAGVPCCCLSVRGDFPADAILQTATQSHCDLIVMASHGRRGMAAIVLGSETQKVLAHAHIPVLVHR